MFPEAAALCAAQILALNDHVIWSNVRAKQLNTWIGLKEADKKSRKDKWLFFGNLIFIIFVLHLFCFNLMLNYTYDTWLVLGVIESESCLNCKHVIDHAVTSEYSYLLVTTVY